MSAACLLARATGEPGDIEEAERALAESDLPPADRLRALFALFRLRRRPDILREARRLLDGFTDMAPPAYRESMLENVPLYREIMEAWAEHGERVEKAADE